MNPGFDAADLPDAAHFGRIVVYRHWKLWRVFRRELRLIGIALAEPWLDGWNTATCRRDPFDDPPEEEHPVVYAGCGCGYWGYWLPMATQFTVPRGAPSVFGAIEVAGRLRVGDLGVRTERARILGVVAVHDTADLLRETYPSVTVYDGVRELVRDHPQTDAESLLGETPEHAFAGYLCGEVTRWYPHRRILGTAGMPSSVGTTLALWQQALGQVSASSTARVHARRRARYRMLSQWRRPDD